MEPVRQLRLLAAGSQPWNANVCVAAPPYFAYAATQSVYVYREEAGRGQWRLDCILTAHSKLITCLDWLPGGLLATSGADRLLCAWNVAEQRVAARASLDSTPRLAAWSPHEPDLLAVSGARGPLLAWRCLDAAPAPLRPDSVSPFSSEVQQMAWHPRRSKLAVGHKNGTVSVVPTSGRVQRHVQLPEPHDERDEPVTALAWDPLSDDYLLVSQRGAGLLLIDTANFSAIQAFERPAAAGDCHLAWFTNAPGMFAAADSGAGVLSVFGAGGAAPLEKIAVKAAGFHGARLMCGEGAAPSGGRAAPPARLLAAFEDGGVGVFNLVTRRWEFLQESGHTETIFDVKFQPGQQDQMATGSYDGTVKVWNARRIEPLDEHRASTIIYAVSWAPAELRCLAAATSSEGVLLWSLDKHRVVRQFREHGSHCVYNVSWNGHDSRRLASAGGDGACVVRQVDGTLLHSYPHPGGVYGCEWRDAATLATGCQDGAVRVFDVTRNQTTPLHVLKGHTGRAFQVRWNPVVGHVLASGSDDSSVRVWDTESGECLRVLSGHHSHVRGLAWCSELAHVLVSGSWDYTIRVWDARAGGCLHVIKEHAADVYGLSIHPVRPFLLVSSSRDSTVRLWDLSPLFGRLQRRALVTENADDVLGAPLRALSAGEEPRLRGLLAARLRSRWDSAETRLRLAAALFTPDPDAPNLWDLVAVRLGETDTAKLSADYAGGLVHRDHLAASLAGRAARLERAAAAGGRLPAGGGGGPGQSQRRAAQLYLRCGQLRRYCDIMAQLGDWERALALAPGVSVNYWRQLAERRAAQLLEQDDDDLPAFSLAVGRPHLTVEQHRRRGRPLDALEAAMALSSRAARPPPPPAAGDESAAPADGDRETVAGGASADTELLSVAGQASESYLVQGRPVLAACCHLAVDDVAGCLRVLLRGHLRELAVVLGRLLAARSAQEDAVLTEALVGLSRRCQADADWPTAVQLLGLVPLPEAREHALRELGVLASGDDAHADEALALAGFSSAEQCLERAKERDAEDELQVALLLMGRQLEPALELALRLVDARLLSEQAEQQAETLRLLQVCAAVPRRHAARISAFLPTLQALAAFAGGREALRRGQAGTATLLLRHAAAGLRLVTQRRPRLALQDVTALLGQAGGGGADSDQVYVTGCQLPGHGRLLRCYLTGAVIRGAVYTLEDGESVLPAGLAVMWAAVNRYSPLRTGAQLFP